MRQDPDLIRDRPDDPLSELIRLVRPSRLNWKVGNWTGAWESGFPATNGVAFCLIAEGAARAVVPGHGELPLGARDFLLLVQPPSWSLRSDVVEPSQTRIVGGHFRVDPGHVDLLPQLLPRVAVVKGADSGATRVKALMELIADEAGAARPGRSLMLEELVSALMLEAIRHDRAAVENHVPGLIAGLADARLAAALRAIHQEPARAWTIEAMAEFAGQSRSVFSERFARTVGVPPLTYLTRWRIALAKRALSVRGANLTEIAEAVGYASPGAFSTAFSREAGCSPSEYARRCQA